MAFKIQKLFSPKITLLMVLMFTSSTDSLLEKIFTHERGPSNLQKQGRIEDLEDYEILKRALEEFSESVPKYTGFYLLDLIFEIFKTVFVFFLTLMIPANDLSLNRIHYSSDTGASMPNSNNGSTTTPGVHENMVK